MAAGASASSKAGVDSLMPAFSPDGKTVFYCTEEGGGYNLAKVDPQGAPTSASPTWSTAPSIHGPSPDGR